MGDISIVELRRRPSGDGELEICLSGKMSILKLSQKNDIQVVGNMIRVMKKGNDVNITIIVIQAGENIATYCLQLVTTRRKKLFGEIFRLKRFDKQVKQRMFEKGADHLVPRRYNSTPEKIEKFSDGSQTLQQVAAECSQIPSRRAFATVPALRQREEHLVEYAGYVWELLKSLWQTVATPRTAGQGSLLHELSKTPGNVPCASSRLRRLAYPSSSQLRRYTIGRR